MSKTNIDEFEKYLLKADFSQHTISSYIWTVRDFLDKHSEISAENISIYRLELMDNRNPKTVNLRLSALNRYLKFLDKEYLKIPTIKVQQKPYVDNVISFEDYDFLKHSLKKDGYIDSYFLVWILGATGTRVSEFVQLKIEHVKKGHCDLYGKGKKMRRIYFPKTLQVELLGWLAENNRESGYLFRGHETKSNGGHISIGAVGSRLDEIGKRYAVDKTVMHPHSFRHMYAMTFLDRGGDMFLLADLMGHESLETTRIYLRRTATQQRAKIDEIITW
ncbi:integrase [Clostridia bacterium]|nr:integrase [Clostridia bacterium]